MHITMVKKKLKGGVDCRKCEEATQHLQARGLWNRIDEVIWAYEDNPGSPGMQLSKQLGVDRAPFFVVREDGTEKVYTSVLQLVRERLGQSVSNLEQAREVDPDDIGGI